MNNFLRILLILGGVFFALIGGFFLFIYIAFNGIFTGPSYNQSDLIENYENKKEQIIEVKNYIEKIVPENIFVNIEFKNGDLETFHVKRNGNYENNWHLDIDSKKTDSLLNILGWTHSELETLKDKLDKANCISVASRKPITIGWQRSAMGMFFYKLFDQNLNDSLIEQYNGGCTYIFYKDNVVLQYGGGAIGPQCFPGFVRKELPH